MRRLVVVTCVVLLSCSGTSWSFDGARKGFVLGGGLGFAPIAIFEVERTGEDASQVAGAGHIVIGYAWDNMNLLVLEGNAAVYNPSDYAFTVTQGWGGVSWYHYFAPEDKSFFTAVGIGAMNFEISATVAGGSFEFVPDPGVGFMAGAGYSFARHFQVGLYVAGGKTKYNPPPLSVLSEEEYRHLNVSILVSGIAF